MSQLTARQRAILDFIGRFIEEKDYPPSIRDIQQACNISSTSVVDYNLKALERMALIRRDREVSRAIELLDGRGRRQRTVVVPLVGRIAAGKPIPVPSSDTWAGGTGDTVEVTEAMTRGRDNVFALQVQGTSMIDALINDGDIVIMEATASVDEGDMAAVWLRREEETTLKKVFHEGERVRLQPANSAMQPFYTESDNIEIQGRVLSTLRMD